MTTLISEIPVAVPQQARQADETPSNARSRITAPRVEPRDSLAAKLLSAQRSDAEDGNGETDLLIQGLVDGLPQANGVWSLDDRAKWLRTAVSIFDLVYKADDGEDREIGIVLAKPEIERTA
jgi:hypothetical protein